jgi:hypothetical protein
MSQYPTAPIDLSGMETVPPGEIAMGDRLRALGWTKTERFANYNVYYSGSARTGYKRIGVTLYHVTVAPCAHTHYAIPLAA